MLGNTNEVWINNAYHASTSVGVGVRQNVTADRIIVLRVGKIRNRLMNDITEEAFNKFMEQMMPYIRHSFNGALGFPANYCWDTSVLIFNKVREHFRGNFFVIWGSFDGRSHCWIQDTRTDTILDPTLGQFIGGIAYRLVTKDNPLYSRYSKVRPYL